MAGHVERGSMPGLIALLARQGRAHVEVIGTMAFGDTEPMGRDAIFSIASLTKPIAAAAMILVDADLTGILFTQRALTSPTPPDVFTDFWKCAYQAITRG